MVVTASEFAKRVADAGLMTPAELDHFLATLPTEFNLDDGGQLARQLVQKGKLTAYQAQVIYQGKGRLLVMGKYVILGKLGQGGMGIVFKAQHRTMRRTVALKVLSRTAKRVPGAVRRFQREVQAAGLLEHPNIVTAYDADEAEGQPFLVLQYVDGADLSTLVKQQGPLPVPMAVSCILQAAHGLEYAHLRGVVHRDIKPSNLMLGRDGTLKILDMGLVRFDLAHVEAVTSELTKTCQLIGTADYMAPEQAANMKLADARSDIYSLGYTLWYLLTGREAYGGESQMERLVAHWEKPIPSLREACSEVSAALESIFMKMVAKKPDDRYQSMTEVITDLERCRMAEAAAASHPLSSREDRELDDFLQVVAGEEAEREAKGARQSPAERTSTAEQQAASSDTQSSNGRSVTSSQRQQARRDAAADRRSRRHPPRKRRSFARFVRLTTGSITAAGLLVAVIAFWPEESGGNRLISRPNPPAPASDISPGGLPPLVGGPDALQLGAKDLNDWQQIEQAKWAVKEGLLHGSGQQGCLLSKAAYDDFELALSYRLSRGAIGGIVLQASRKGNLSEFLEVQLVEDATVTDPKIFDPGNALEQTPGSRGQQGSRVLAQVRAPADQWSKIILRASGSGVQVWVGSETRHIDLSKVRPPVARPRAAGCVGVRLVRSSIAFRDIWLQEVKSPGTE